MWSMQLFRVESYIYPEEIDGSAVSVDQTAGKLPDTRIPGGGSSFNQ